MFQVNVSGQKKINFKYVFDIFYTFCIFVTTTKNRFCYRQISNMLSSDTVTKSNGGGANKKEQISGDAGNRRRRKRRVDD